MPCHTRRCYAVHCPAHWLSTLHHQRETTSGNEFSDYNFHFHPGVWWPTFWWTRKLFLVAKVTLEIASHGHWVSESVTLLISSMMSKWNKDQSFATIGHFCLDDIVVILSSRHRQSESILNYWESNWSNNKAGARKQDNRPTDAIYRCQTYI